MRNPELIKYIEDVQKKLEIPECFELSQELLRRQTTIESLITRILTNTAGDGDQYAMLEIIKQWLTDMEEGDSYD